MEIRDLMISEGTPVPSPTASALFAWSASLLLYILTLTCSDDRAYGKKYGHRAWLERRQQLEARRAEAQERTDFARYEAEYQMRLQQQHSGTST